MSAMKERKTMIRNKLLYRHKSRHWLIYFRKGVLGSCRIEGVRDHMIAKLARGWRHSHLCPFGKMAKIESFPFNRFDRVKLKVDLTLSRWCDCEDSCSFAFVLLKVLLSDVPNSFPEAARVMHTLEAALFNVARRRCRPSPPLESINWKY